MNGKMHQTGHGLTSLFTYLYTKLINFFLFPIVQSLFDLVLRLTPYFLHF